ncbi:MAG TPA: thiamine-binding protein [Segetibacter sp.]|jgi:uncharacterized protein YqgV (UPF0045/DUF77 family)
MHNHIINASIQILPIVQDKHPYEWVDEAIFVIQQSGVKYKIGPFATIVEGTYEQVLSVVNAVNEHLIATGCGEWITSVQFNIRSNSDITANEKVSKFIAQ